jgi:hypothetical protein
MWGPPGFLHDGGSFPNKRQPGGGGDHPSPTSAEVKEKVELYIYSPSVSALHVMGRRLYLLGPRNEVTTKYKELGN